MAQFTATTDRHSINLSEPQDTAEDIIIQTSGSLHTFEISAAQKTSGSLIIHGDLEVEVFAISALLSLGADLRIEGNLTVHTSFNISKKVVIGGAFRVTENINIGGMRISKGASVTTHGWSSLGTWVTKCTVNGSINIAGSITAPFGFHFHNLDINGEFQTPQDNYQRITTGNSSGKPIKYY